MSSSKVWRRNPKWRDDEILNEKRDGQVQEEQQSESQDEKEDRQEESKD